MTGQRIGPKGLSFLSTGIQSSNSLKKLSLPRNGICSVESITTLCYALQSNNSIETLDLSENDIDDNAAEGLKELIKSNGIIKNLKLDHNLISTTYFAVSLCENNSITHFSISFNPLSFENFISLLEMLNINLTLLFIGLKGINFLGSANIKENQSGVLTKQEAIVLKLANTLRHSNLNTISIDIDPSAILQLRELEVTLLKHNTTLINMYSDTINWRAPQQEPLLGIQKALKANSWLKKHEGYSDEEIPIDIESIIASKRFSQRLTKKSRDLCGSMEFDSEYINSHYLSTENANFSSPIATSPDFSTSAPQISDIRNSIKRNRISKNESLEKRKSFQYDKGIEEIMGKMLDDYNIKMQYILFELMWVLQKN